jgi:hypothetical protein
MEPSPFSPTILRVSVLFLKSVWRCTPSSVVTLTPDFVKISQLFRTSKWNTRSQQSDFSEKRGFFPYTKEHGLQIQLSHQNIVNASSYTEKSIEVFGKTIPVYSENFKKYIKIAREKKFRNFHVNAGCTQACSEHFMKAYESRMLSA